MKKNKQSKQKRMNLICAHLIYADLLGGALPFTFEHIDLTTISWKWLGKGSAEDVSSSASRVHMPELLRGSLTN